VIERYRDPFITTLFSDDYRLQHYRDIELAYLEARRELGDETVTDQVLRHIRQFRVPTMPEIAEQEEATGHDVVAFLYTWTKNMDSHAQSVIHRGLTSSDLVDNVLFLQLRTVVELVERRLIALAKVLSRLHLQYKDTPRVGRTHGQAAEPTRAGWRFFVWNGTISALRHQAGILQNELAVFKTPGATGSMRLLGREVGLAAARQWASDSVVMLPSTQVIPRQRMVLWAGWLVAVASLVEEIALEVRLSSRTEVGELAEGAARDRVGSSAIPHKRNPIGSERLSGMGRLVRSNFAAVAESAGALHHERDISNSSVERVAVPDLSHLVAFMTSEAIKILEGLEVNTAQMVKHVDVSQDSALMQYRLQGLGLPYAVAQVEAGLWARSDGWDYTRILGLVNNFRYERGLSLFNDREALRRELDG
jgi:adenylosuccinate lyase